MILPRRTFPSTPSMLLVVMTMISYFFALSSPLLSTPTIESAMFLGMFLAPFSFIAGASRGALKHRNGLLHDLTREGTWVFAPVAFYLFLLLLKSFFVQSCSPGSGVIPFLLIIVPQLSLSLVTGIVLGRMIGHVRAATIIGLIVLGLYLALQGFLWWLNPSLRFFDMYWFLFLGDLLKGQALEPAVIAYRISALFYVGLIVSLGIRWKRRTTQAWAVLFFLIGGVSMHLNSKSKIAPAIAERQRDYPDELKQGLVTIHTNFTEVGKTHAEGIMQEAHFWLSRLQNRTGLEPKKQINIWVYQNGDSLARHTGARNIHYALPTHREIHIVGAQVPHPVLGHELAHIILGEVSNTVWKVPGVFRLLPNWGLSEGLATYLTPELSLQDHLTDLEIASAFDQLGLLKHPETLLEADFGSFWFQSSRRGYTASAALLGAYINSRCSTDSCRSEEVVNLASAGRVSFAKSFLKDYRLQLGEMPLPPYALPVVSSHFSKDSILAATCVDGQQVQIKPKEESLVQRADILARQGLFSEALARYNQIPLLEQPIHKQREITIKKAMLKNTPYAKAALELLTTPQKNWVEKAADYGKLGFFLRQPSTENLSFDYASYLLARLEIQTGNFYIGQSLMPSYLTGPIGQEARRLLGIAQAQTGQIKSAIVMFELLESRAERPADKIWFRDLKERAEAMARGEKYLLGVWTDK